MFALSELVDSDDSGARPAIGHLALPWENESTQCVGSNATPRQGGG